jgi:hypothetical protein
VGLNLGKQFDEDVLDDVVGVRVVQALFAQESQEHRPVDGVELVPPLEIMQRAVNPNELHETT